MKTKEEIAQARIEFQNLLREMENPFYYTREQAAIVESWITALGWVLDIPRNDKPNNQTQPQIREASSLDIEV